MMPMIAGNGALNDPMLKSKYPGGDLSLSPISIPLSF